MGTPELLRVALLTNAPAPYRTSFFNELAKHCHLLVAFDTKREPDREWSIDEDDFQFDWSVTRAVALRRRAVRGRSGERPVLQVPLNTLAVLERFRPDVVVSDELGTRTAWAALFCRLRRRPLIVWWEGVPHSDGTGALRTLRRRVLLRSARRAWGNGVESARSLANYGVRVDHADLGMTGTDTVRWRTDVDHQLETTRRQVRAEHGLHGAVLLFVGRLTPLKGVPEMLSALSALHSLPDVPPWSVLFVGEGPSRDAINQWAAAHPVVPIALAGFVQPADLAHYFAAADVFVMPSLEDVWGLVCLEALVAGLPQLTSGVVGAAPDLITSRDIGEVVDAYAPEAFARSLADRVREAPQRVSDEARDHAMATWSPTAAAQRAIVSIRACLEDDQKAPSASGDEVVPDAIVTVSVDDGHPRDRRAADMLADLGYSATFYIPARNPERPVMARVDLRAIAERFEVGGHTLNHAPLTQLSREAAYREIVDGRSWLEDAASSPVVSFCYPRGKFNAEVAQLVKAAGFAGARTTMGNIVTRTPDVFRSGVTTQAYSHSRTIQFRHAAHERNWRGMADYGRIFRFATTWGEHFERGVAHVVAHGGVAHLWFHSWELDAYGQWGDLEATLRRLKSDYRFRTATNGEVFTSV